ncbi:hypothetical protein NA57DRAFT_51390 [Rhizodiscina lignyota]|uniref:Uncharacterized protein n=1 Tax=Rhizodiscina lignyota TaxID=1504668 RepID=A0A9P4IN45_9PEZI|nr:hypothetical protein NA57DRAFT_51390 [Rhizodiscina lignyota]
MAMLGLGVFYGGVIVGIPVVTGVAEGVQHQKEQNKEAANEERMVKFHLDVFCGDNSPKRKEVDGTMVVMRNGKVYLSPKGEDKQPLPPAGGGPAPHPFTGFYIMYPDDDRSPPQRGLVSTISVDPPMLNWIYADRDTLELKYGNRTQSIEHTVGPWDWTEDESGVTLEDWEGFVAVEEDDGWAIYYDINDDRLDNGNKVGGKKVLQCSLERRVFDEEQQKQDMEAADKKMSVKKTGDLKTQWG